jgi:shikimate kinase
MSNVFLVGFMGSGKSSVGRALAQRLGLQVVDLDERLIQRFGVPIPEIFDAHGEPAFRAAEREELVRCCGLDDLVVATGGGAFCDGENRRIIHSSGGVSVFIDVPWPVLQDRLQADHSDRPMYSGAESALRLFEERLPHYRQADVIAALDGGESPDEAADRIAQALQGAPCAT